MTIQNFCFNCLSPVTYPPNKFVFESDRMGVKYSCGSKLEWFDYDMRRKTWSVSIQLKCKPKHDFTYDDENDYEY